MSNEFLFVQDVSAIVPEGYRYGVDRVKDEALTREVFELRGVDISELDLYAFDVYYPRQYNPIVAFIAAPKINTSERGGWLEHSLRQTAEHLADGVSAHKTVRLVNRISNYLVDAGAVQVSAVRHTDLDHYSEESQQKEFSPSIQVIDEELGNYGCVLEVSSVGRLVIV